MVKKVICKWEAVMTRRAEIAYMQARIARFAVEKWGLSINEIGRLFAQYQVFQHIKDCYDLYHMEGDEAVWEDIQPYLRHRGCPYA